MAAPRARGRVRWARPGRFLRDLNMVVLLAVVAAASGLLMLPRTDDGLLGLPELTIGEQCPQTVRSPRRLTVADPQMTAEARARAVAEIPPTYDRLMWMGNAAKRRVEDAFAAVARAEADGDGAVRRADAFMLELGVTVDEAQLLPVIDADNPDELRDAMIMVAQMLFESRIVQDRPYLRLQAQPNGVTVRTMDRDGTVQGESTLASIEAVLGVDQARARVDALVAEELERLEPEQRRAVAWVVKRLVQANLVANKAETERRRAARRASVREVVIPVEAGDVVVRAGETINRQHQLILAALRKDPMGARRLLPGAGAALVMMFLTIFAYRVARRSYQPKPRHRDLAFLATAFVLSMLVFWLGYKGALSVAETVADTVVVSPTVLRFAIPAALGVLLVRFVAGMEAAAVFTAVMALAGGWIMDGSLEYAAFVMFGGLAAASAADATRIRNLVWSAGLRVLVAQSLAVLGLALLGGRASWSALGPPLAAAAAGGLITLIGASLVLPVVELLFGFTTPHRLQDLANLDHPLMRDLLVEAPGTYHHSILVGALAEKAAEAIGADGLLAKVGGYYHDIGKLHDPRRYEENSAEAFSGLTPEQHAEALRAHLDAGIELAAEHRLGAPVVEILAQHHGSAVVRAPYRRALARRGAGAVDPTPFRYPGPAPVAKTAAVVLLADAVETATRSLDEEVTVSRTRIDDRVRSVLREILEDGQLDRCELTLRDLGLVNRAFVDVLEDRLTRRGRPTTLTGMPALSDLPVVRPPPGEPN